METVGNSEDDDVATGSSNVTTLVRPDPDFPPEPPYLVARVVSSQVSLRARLRELWQSRELFVFFVRKELKVKYKGSVLGLLWSMLNPAVTLMVYYVVFKYFLVNDVPDFALYLFSGLIVWNFFLTAIIGSASTIVANAGIVKKVAFPREILALAQVGTSAMFFFFQGVVLVVFLVGFEYAPAWRYLPLVLFGFVDLVVFTSALAIFFSAVNVYLRDVEHLIAVLLNAWFWGVPIIYSFNKVYDHPHLKWLGYLYLADPMTVIILAFQRAISGKVTYITSSKSPVYSVVNGKLATHIATVTSQPIAQLADYPYHFYLLMLLWVFGVGVVLLLGALLVFGRVEGNFAEEL
jgi:ABC-2 type transport system permease protein